MIRFLKIFLSGTLLFLILVPSILFAQTVNVDASRLRPTIELFFSPKTGTFVEGTTFDVPILLNTKGTNINGIEITVNFDKNKLSIVRPSGGTSIIGVWVEPPTYDNTRGVARYVGVIPNGIVTQSGLIGNITFQAKATGLAAVSFTSNSKVLLNDGLGTEAVSELGRAGYTIIPSAPGGVNIFSDTHPFQSEWYNNNSPVISWDKGPEVEGFSYVLDNKPSTVPENKVNIDGTVKSFENLTDGLWYFHIKAIKAGIWGSTGHFIVRIDTAPPALFTPTVNYLVAAPVLVDRTLVSFFTTDNLSGVDHYEVGVIDKAQPTTVSPVFVRADSPFQVPLVKDSKLQVIVRAIDKAGNIRDESIEVAPPFLIEKFLKDNIIYILIAIILAGLIGLILHYIFGHHIKRGIRKAREFIYREKPDQEIIQIMPQKRQQFEMPENKISTEIGVPIKPLPSGITLTGEPSAFRDQSMDINNE